LALPPPIKEYSAPAKFNDPPAIVLQQFDAVLLNPPAIVDPLPEEVLQFPPLIVEHGALAVFCNPHLTVDDEPPIGSVIIISAIIIFFKNPSF
jgi:hypothetical protein